MKSRSLSFKAVLGLGTAALFALTLAVGCSPTTAAPASSSEDDASLSSTGGTWSIDGDCGTCHDSEQASMGDTSCIAAAHTSASCISCHSDEDGALTQVHDGATADDVSSRTKLKKTTVAAATCQTCHSQDDLIAKTANVDVLTDDEGTTVNPHDLPDTGDHAGIECIQCHTVHEEGDKMEVAAQKTCRTCHHQNVYKCYTCHE